MDEKVFLVDNVSPLDEPPREASVTVPVGTIPVIHSQLFETFLKQCKRDMPKYNKPYAVPDVIQGFCRVIFIHSKDESFDYNFPPSHTHVMEDVYGFWDRLNLDIHNVTDGVYRRVDATTVRAMRRPDFKSLLLAFFHLKGSWLAERVPKRCFRNGDGTIAENVRFIRLRRARVNVADGIMKVHVLFRAGHDQKVGGVVCFTMPVEEEEGIYEDLPVEIPLVAFEDRRVTNDDDGMTVINFRYGHNEKGFNVLPSFREKCKYDDTAKKTFVLDKPFRVSVWYMFSNVLRVEVDNLKGEASLPFYS